MIKKFMMIFGFVLLSALTTFSQSAKEYFASGKIKYDEGRYAEALKDFNKALKSDKNFHKARLWCGLTYEKTGDNKKALKEYTLIIKKDDSYYEAYEKRAALYRKMKEYKKAIADYTSAIGIKRKPFAFLYRADCYVATGQYELAKVDYSVVKAMLPNNIRAKLGLANVAFLEKDYDNALTILKRIIEENEKESRAYLLRAKVYRALKKTKKCCDDLKKANSPDNKEAAALLKQWCPGTRPGE